MSRESVVRQMKIALWPEPPAGAADLIAYEPVWAIGELVRPPHRRRRVSFIQALRPGALRAVWSRDGNPYPAALWRQRNAAKRGGIAAPARSMGCLSAARHGTRKADCDIVQRVTQEFICRRSNIKGHQRWKFQAMIEQDSRLRLLTEIAVAYYDQDKRKDRQTIPAFRVSKSSAC